jgi:hypothetical protein
MGRKIGEWDDYELEAAWKDHLYKFNELLYNSEESVGCKW